MIAFYAFCRVVDDIADDADIPDAKRFQELDSWETGLKEGFKNPDPVQAEMVRICHKFRPANRDCSWDEDGYREGFLSYF